MHGRVELSFHFHVGWELEESEHFIERRRGRKKKGLNLKKNFATFS
jgi:hypothetical protein